MRKILIVVAGAVGLSVVVGFVWVTAVVSDFMVTNQDASREAVSRINLECPADSLPVSRPWGKTGWSAFCDRNGTPHGSWLAVEVGRLQIRGEYLDGTRCGTWEWLNLDGTVMKREIFGGCR